MKLTFFGAARAVTGSCHCVECGGKKYLVDCGLQQGRDERDDQRLDFDPGMVESVVVTHAHIDHSGRLPLLVKQGFLGDIHCTRLTGKLIGIMLLDSAHIQESDAQWQNQKGKRSGKALVEPLYTIADAQKALEHVVTHEYGERFSIGPGVEGRFTDAGHLLGSAEAELWLTEGDATKKVVFSGDLGNIDKPIIRDPQSIQGGADYVLTESTYGDRLHEGDGSYKEELAAIIDETISRGGNVVIPSFAVGRTQEMLYFIREIKEEHLVKSVPDFEVVVDSPLAKEATEIFSGDLHGYLDEEAIEAIRKGNLFKFPGLTLTQTVDESRALNGDGKARVILSASGMCDAGRIRHHLKHNLWRPESTVVFVGYQAEGSLGRRLLEGAASVKLFGEEIAVRAKIVRVKGMSSHADKNGLLKWMEEGFGAHKPEQVFVVHGDRDVTTAYAETLKERGFAAHAPDYEEVYDLLTNTMLSPGLPPVERQAQPASPASSPSYRRLEEVGQQLLSVISRNKGGANKDLARFADQIRAVIQKWDR